MLFEADYAKIYASIMYQCLVGIEPATFRSESAALTTAPRDPTRRLRKFHRAREIEFNFFTPWTISMKPWTLVHHVPGYKILPQSF